MITLLTHKNWMYEEFKRNRVHEVKQSHGLDAPDTTQKGMGWWMPQAYAVKTNTYAEQTETPQLKLIAPIESTLSELPQWATRRNTLTVDANTAASPLLPWEGEHFWKLATAKTETFEPAIRTWEEILPQLLSVPHDSLIQMSEPKPFTVEYRCFILNHKVVTHSIYLRNNVTVYDGATEDTQEVDRLTYFASEVAAWLEDAEMAASAYVLDVGFNLDGEPAVVEVNPAWCAGWYNCDMDAVAATVHAASNASDSQMRLFGWKPDPVLVRDYSNIVSWLR